MPHFFDGAFSIILILGLFLFSEMHRRKRVKSAISSRPAKVTSWIPWVGNAIQYSKNPHAFLERCRKSYGPVFTTLLAGRYITFLLEPSLISALFRNSKDLEFSPIRADVQQTVFATSYQGSVHAAVEGEVYPNSFEHFSKLSLSKVTRRYSKRLLESFRSMKSSPSKRPNSLWNLVFPEIYTSSSKATFGDSFPLSTFCDFLKFDEGFPRLAAKIPTIFIHSYDSARSRLITELVQWAIADKRGEHTPAGVSPLVAEAVQTMQHADFEPSDIGSHLLSLLWGTQANSLWISFWFLAYILQDPDYARRLRKELDDALSTRFGNSIEALIEADPNTLFSDGFTLLESGFHETMRLSSGLIIARQISKDMTLHSRGGNSMQLLEGDTVFITPRNLHMSEDIFEDPGAFQIDRFVADDGKSLRQYTFDGGHMPHNLLLWGGGTHICKGRFVAQYQIKMFITLVLHSFYIQPSYVVDRKTGKPADRITLPRIDETCIGVLHSHDDILCDLTSR